MLRPRSDTRISFRDRENSPPRLDRGNNQRKRHRIEVAGAERSNINLALTLIPAVASEYSTEPPRLILMKLPQFAANYVALEGGIVVTVGMADT
jgi:hypothetical protein